MERITLINICKAAVVHHTKWEDRDSYIAQKGIQLIHKALTAGLEYNILDETDEESIWIDFPTPINFKKLDKGISLNISSREDYFRDCDPEYETEMFDSFDEEHWKQGFTRQFMPTAKRLVAVGEGNDWY